MSEISKKPSTHLFTYTRVLHTLVILSTTAILLTSTMGIEEVNLNVSGMHTGRNSQSSTVSDL